MQTQHNQGSVLQEAGVFFHFCLILDLKHTFFKVNKYSKLSRFTICKPVIYVLDNLLWRSNCWIKIAAVTSIEAEPTLKSLAFHVIRDSLCISPERNVRSPFHLYSV